MPAGAQREISYSAFAPFFVLPTLLVVGLTAALMASYPWFVVSVFGLLYLVSIPFSYRSYRRLDQGLQAPPEKPEADALEPREEETEK